MELPPKFEIHSNMNKLLSPVFLLLFLAPLSTVSAEELVREFSGSRTTQTAEFEMKAPWLIDWRGNS